MVVYPLFNSLVPIRAEKKRVKAISMMTPEEYLDRNIKTLTEVGKRSDPFGVSYIQRVCRVGYNQACHTIDRAIEQGVLERDADCEWLVRFAL